MKIESLPSENSSRDQLLAYLYHEMSPAERLQFENEFRQNPELQKIYQQWTSLQSVFRKLDTEKAPRHLSKKLFEELGFKKPWYQQLMSGIVWPAVAGTAVLMITLGVARQFQNQTPQAGRFAQRAIVVPSSPSNAESGDLEFADLFLRRRESPMKPPPRLAYRQPSNNLISLASYGDNNYADASADNFTNFNYPKRRAALNNEPQPEPSVVNFVHKQAVELQAIGDHEGAAKKLAWLVKNYPNSAQKYKFLAERINCLFEARDYETAKKELTWLQSLDPDLAYIVQSRWIQ